jgi:hypothetical protein
MRRSAGMAASASWRRKACRGRHRQRPHLSITTHRGAVFYLPAARRGTRPARLPALRHPAACSGLQAALLPVPSAHSCKTQTRHCMGSQQVLQPVPAAWRPRTCVSPACASSSASATCRDTTAPQPAPAMAHRTGHSRARTLPCTARAASRPQRARGRCVSEASAAGAAVGPCCFPHSAPPLGCVYCSGLSLALTALGPTCT